jgi:nucleoside 2-deoxyribosyltransferase
MATCFVIQPFDSDVFDRRYREVFKPAIQAAGLEPYRVDEDPAATIPIDQIERGIRQAKVCFAEITTDNPNSWYELGYAIARGKQVVLVCAEDRRSRFPFDVQHRKIIQYRSGSPGDFEVLRAAITEHLLAAEEKEEALEELSESTPIAPTAGLSDSELATLATLGQTVDA